MAKKSKIVREHKLIKKVQKVICLHVQLNLLLIIVTEVFLGKMVLNILVSGKIISGTEKVLQMFLLETNIEVSIKMINVTDLEHIFG